MTISFLNLLRDELTRNGRRITPTGVSRLMTTANDEFKVDASEREWLNDLATKDVFDSPATRDALRSAIAALPTAPDFTGRVSGLELGPYNEHLNDDTLYLPKDGVVDWDAGFTPFTRSYLPVVEGPLRLRLGSAVPPSSALTASERAAIAQRTPGQSLVAAAAGQGVALPDVDALFSSKRFFDPSAPDWEGSCHSWTPLSLHPKLDGLVDVPGAEGSKGLWYGDQFFSRAELGNLAMALGDTITNSPQAREYGDNFVTALDVLKAAQLYLGDRKVGFQADVWNDVDRGDSQVWNQPFFKGALTSTTLSGPAAAAIARVAATDPYIADTSALAANAVTVKQVTFTGTYGKEVADDWEGAPGEESRTWTMYAVTDARGRVLQAYNASDERLRTLALPTHTSSELPDFLVRPNLQFVDDAFVGKANPLVDRDPNGKAFRFLLSEVLQKGVSAATRSEFERAVAALPPGAISRPDAQRLATRYPGMASAYASATWQRAFASRGLDAAAFR